ncbi:tyrosine-type recombinase/integrase [Salmonella enterica subsp. enterica serovar Muenchen]|nr:tyrosine-type recombinase/integrase [Salmonella enterica subsp. enterica serovar Muenchen]
MNDTSSDDILLLKQRLAEQEALNRALLEKLADREHEIDHLQAQLDKLRRMNFGSRSEKVSRRIAQMEADLNRLQKESDTLTGRVDDPAVQRPLRQTRTRKPFPESLPRDEKRLLPAEPCCPDCGGTLSYLGEDAAEQLELMRSAFRVNQYVSQLQMMVATLKIPLERRNRRTGRTEKARIWEITDRTVRTWIGEAVEAAAADGVTFSVPVTPHTFRHSYAMHMLYAGIPLKVLQSLMGHKSVSSTEVYTKVFALDVAARHRVQFQMPGTDAVAMLKGIS